MKIVSSYKVRLPQKSRQAIKQTEKIFQDAVSYTIGVVDKEWGYIKSVIDKRGKKFAQPSVEHLIHGTKKNIAKYDFDKRFVKMPSYLRRSVISTAIGAVSSYRSNLSNWELNGKIGSPPILQEKRASMPTFFRTDMSQCDDLLNGNSEEAYLKLFNGSDWVWMSLKCRKQDVKYLRKYWSNVKASAPTLEKNCDHYYLRFAFEVERDLSKRDEPLENQVILAVDLGINTDATCSVMKSDGTVVARKFINFPIEKDHRDHLLNRIKGCQQKKNIDSARKLWDKVVRINTEHSKKVANAIVDFSVEYAVNTIVFEYLNIKGKKRGPRKQRLAMWRKNSIQKMVEHKAHMNLIRISHVNAWGTSRLAFDGSGRVERNISVNGQAKNYSLCCFPFTEEGKHGKIYNCDLNASYNIGARYFLREMCKLDAQLAKILPASSQRTYSNLINLMQHEILLGNKQVS